MSEVSVKRLRAVISICAVIGLGLLVWFQAGDLLSKTARRMLAGFSEDHSASSAKPAIRFANDDAGNVIAEVYNLDSESLAQLKEKNLSNAELAQIFAIYTGESVPEKFQSMPAMLGAYVIKENVIRFTPRFPLVAGLAYTAQFDASAFAEKTGKAISGEETRLQSSYSMPKAAYSSATFITNVYPSDDLLPANQLKLYIHFSAPMSVGEAYDHIKLFDDRGREVAKPFLRLEEELWDGEHRRLTMWFDPGRIKRGLRPNADMGAPLEEGKHYRLTIDSGWRDDKGNPLREGFEKRFQTTRADRAAPDYKEWKLISPEAGSSEPVTIVFSEAMDQALMESSIEVIDGDGNPVQGRIEISKGETEWRFTPHTSWGEGNYKIYIETRLEDRAGNSIHHLFDSDMRKAQPSTPVPQRIELHFEPKISAGR
jgi:hypothetical protein